MKQADPRLASRLAVDYVWELVEVNQAQIRAAADQQTSRVNEQMHNQLNGGQGNFIDTTFPPNRYYFFPPILETCLFLNELDNLR